MGSTCSKDAIPPAGPTRAGGKWNSHADRRRKSRRFRSVVNEEDLQPHTPLGPLSTSQVISPAPETHPPTDTSQAGTEAVGSLNPLRGNQEPDLFSFGDIPTVRSSNVPSHPPSSRASSADSTCLGVSEPAFNSNAASCAMRSSEMPAMFRPPILAPEAQPLRHADLLLLDQSSSALSSSNVAPSPLPSLGNNESPTSARISVSGGPMPSKVRANGSEDASTVSKTPPGSVSTPSAGSFGGSILATQL